MMTSTPIFDLDLIATMILDREDIADLVTSRDAIEVAWFLINEATDLEVDRDDLAKVIMNMILDPFNN